MLERILAQVLWHNAEFFEFVRVVWQIYPRVVNMEGLTEDVARALREISLASALANEPLRVPEEFLRLAAEQANAEQVAREIVFLCQYAKAYNQPPKWVK